MNVGRLRDGYYGSLMLALMRIGIVTETNKTESVIVWHKTAILSGGENPEGHVIRILDQVVDFFGAAYFEAGNL